MQQKDTVHILPGDFVYLKGVKEVIKSGGEEVKGKILHEGKVKDITFALGKLTENERKIILCGSLIGYYKEYAGK